MARITVEDIKSRKVAQGATPIVSLTAYTQPMAKFLDPHCDFLLVGDSLAMVVYGLETTRGVTIEIMCAHGRAVTRGAKQALVVVDPVSYTHLTLPTKA